VGLTTNVEGGWKGIGQLAVTFKIQQLITSLYEVRSSGKLLGRDYERYLWFAESDKESELCRDVARGKSHRQELLRNGALIRATSTRRFSRCQNFGLDAARVMDGDVSLKQS
jgi:hypothetical protein